MKRLFRKCSIKTCVCQVHSDKMLLNDSCSLFCQKSFNLNDLRTCVTTFCRQDLRTFFHRFVWPEKRNPQTVLLFGCMIMQACCHSGHLALPCNLNELQYQTPQGSMQVFSVYCLASSIIGYWILFEAFGSVNSSGWIMLRNLQMLNYSRDAIQSCTKNLIADGLTQVTDKT